MTHYLVFGAGGQLGQEWVRHLQDAGIAVTGLHTADCDITDAAAVARALDAHQPQAVVNCAAYTKVDQAESDALNAFRVNAYGAGFIAKACAERDLPLVHYSTDYVFKGDAADRFAHPDGYPEDHPTEPQGVYGASKAAGEEQVREAGGRALIVRVAWLCGAYGPNFIKTMLRLGAEKPLLRVVADQIGAPSFCDHVVAQSRHLIEHGCTGTWHVASKDATSWHGFAQEALRQAGIATPVQPITTADFPTPALRPAYSRLSVAKLAAFPGAQVETWQTGLGRLIPHLIP